jgi:excisionase family DNA binding protein
MDIEKIFMTVEETSEKSGLPIHIIRSLVHKKDFPALKMGVRWWIHREKFNQWFDKQFRDKSARRAC